MKKILLLFLCLLSCLGVNLTASAAADLEEVKDNLNSRTAILVDAATGEILLDKDAYMTWYPASTTKIMTALLVLEKGRPQDVTTVSSTAVDLEGLYNSRYVSEGMRFTIDQLLHLLLVESDNAACNTLAEYVDGTQEAFVAHMNRKAQELGCVNTHFVTPYGMTDEDHYVTAYDLYLIAKADMQYPLFREIVSQPSYHLMSEDLDVVLYPCNEMVDERSYNYDPRAKGVKTGYTRAAQCNLIGYAEDQGHKLYSVVMGGARTSEGDATYPDTRALYDSGFALLAKRKAVQEAAAAEKAAQAQEAAKQTVNTQAAPKAQQDKQAKATGKNKKAVPKKVQAKVKSATDNNVAVKAASKENLKSSEKKQ